MQKRPEDGGEDRKREDRRVRRTRASIRRAFLDLLDEKSYGQITVTELSERADINRKTFYAYYSGMDELLRELEQDLMEDYEEVCAGINFSIPGFDGKTYFQEISRIIDANLEIIKRLGDLGVLPDLVVRIKDTTVQKFLEKNAGAEAETDIRIALTAEFIATGVLAMFSRWTMDPQMSLDAFVDFAGALAVGGIREAFTGTYGPEG
ncbi:MAG: TetR/AcrR family transcriptional regulator [Lachnospiraceae bacterium]|nr:TetR/AcrR family transcriptional regulator [Lachnospiraceae bacterium]